MNLWEIIIVSTPALLIFLAGADVIISYRRYVQYWALNQYIDELPPTRGRYFVRYVTQREQALREAKRISSYNKNLEKRKTELRHIKLSAATVFVASLLVIGISIGLLSS